MPTVSNQYPNASLIRRFAAILYDGFLIVALWMLTVGVFVAGFNEGEAVVGLHLQLTLYVEIYLFYIYFWRMKGQSLGMQVWKIRLVDENGEMVDIAKGTLHFVMATVTLVLPGLLWILVDPKRLALHDRWSRTRVVYLGSKPYESEIQP